MSHLFEGNLAWATAIKKKDPEFFSKLSKQQAPEILWIGCSDSRVSANQIVGLPPGELFVHRNIANVVVQTDINCQSVIQFAVDVLKVKHIIVCGHYGCGGIKAAMDDANYGPMDRWLNHIKEVSLFNAEKLKALKGDDKFNMLSELNVIEQVSNVADTTVVKNAWKRGYDLSIHGWIYNIKSGLLKDLNTCIASSE